MKESLLLSILIFLFLSKPVTLVGQNNFATQGEQENYWASELFSKGYLRDTFQRFSGQITDLGNNLIKYDKRVLRVFTSNPSIKQIFNFGVFYPDIFDDPRIYDKSLKSISFTKELNHSDNESIDQKDSTNLATPPKKMFVQDTVTISNIEEQIFLSSSPKIKRFKMWVTHSWLHNPIVYFIELTNDSADSSTSNSEFIKKASLTFVRQAWVVI